MSAEDRIAAWQVACRLWSSSHASPLAALSPREVAVLPALVRARAVVRVAVDQGSALCPWCQLQRVPIVLIEARDPVCVCADCGVVRLRPGDLEAVRVDENWMIRSLRRAFEVPPHQPRAELVHGVWGLGTAQGHDIVLARSLDQIVWQQAVLSRARTRARVPDRAMWLVTPALSPERLPPDLPTDVAWLPMEERFWLHGSRLAFREPAPSNRSVRSYTRDTAPAHGPFSDDFRTVSVDGWTLGPISLTALQAALMKALWNARGASVRAAQLMRAAGSRCSKPVDLFKIHEADRATPEAEGPSFAYRALVRRERAHCGWVYSLPCALPSVVDATA